MAVGATRPERTTRTTALSIEERICAGYLFAQAICGIALWVGLAVSPTVSSWLALTPERRELMDVFVLADLGVIVIASALGAWAIAARRTWAVPMTAFTAGAVVYPTLYLIGWVPASKGSGGAALALMVATSTFSCWVAYQTWARR
ncbi:MAG: hypothetical protein HYX32_09870 [Actinobacteria bacterium]|nr:hypothetical protein [Actinomycetota bacterium]